MDQKSRIAILILWLGLITTTFQNGLTEKRVVCYYTNWSIYRPGTAKFSPQNINPYLCTHLIYAFGGFTKDNTLKPFDKYQDIEKGGYAKFTGLKTYNKNLKTMLAIGGWNEGSSRFSPMVADSKRRKEFVKNCVKFLRQNHFDGLDLDWEYPAFRDGGKPRDRNNYANLVQELREQFERESSKTGRPRLLLTMAIPAGIEYLEKGYDIPRLDEYLDFFNLLSYDYHSAYEPDVNHHAPLYPLEEDNEYNYDTELTIDYTIKYLIRQGASSDKIVLGIPTYGRSYTLFNEDATDIGSPADGPGIEGDATREKGYLAYYEICENLEKDDWQVERINPNAMGPYAYKDNQWVGYDDEDIVRKKALYVNENNLGGIMFWSIDNDDFRGKCHGKPYPLIEAAKETLLTGKAQKVEDQKFVSTSIKKENKPPSLQSNSVNRKYSSSNRRTTVAPIASRKRVSPSKTRNKNLNRPSDEDDDDNDDDEVIERKSTIDDEDSDEDGNIVKKPSRPRVNFKTRSRGRSNSSSQKQLRRNDEKRTTSEPLSNKLTTPEPPTTPDPGSDFKCEDEGFFPHPRDCKKYFWCLDSGPSGLGVVAHQFTCPSGLVFNKAADSCDYPRNVICPKSKSKGSSVTTTKAPSTTTRSPKKTTTEEPEPESEEEYEYDDDREEVQEEEPEPPKEIITPKTLLYKTINRSRPTTTTTTTTTAAPTTTTKTSTTVAGSRSFKATTERDFSYEDEEDPRVIKELIELIKKAGGIEQLERQLRFQEKNSSSPNLGQATPATISRSLYERVLNRQNSKNRSFNTPVQKDSDETKNEKDNRNRFKYVNGPGRSQFEGLDEVQEVKSIRRNSRPQYVTIERHRVTNEEKKSVTEEDEEEEEEEHDEEYDDDKIEDVLTTTKKTTQEKILVPKVTPSYSSIRRSRPVASTSRNDKNNKEISDEAATDKITSRRRRPLPSKLTKEERSKFYQRRIGTRKQLSDGNDVDETHQSPGSENSRNVPVFEDNPTAKSRYASIQRFRSATPKSVKAATEGVKEETNLSTSSITPLADITTEGQLKITHTETSVSSTEKSETSPLPIPTYVYSTVSSSSNNREPNVGSTGSTEDNVTKQMITTPDSRLVEESATEILLTTSDVAAPKVTIAAVSHPRPFGFPRRNRLNQSTTSPVPELATESSRPKVTHMESIQLPTLKDVVANLPFEKVINQNKGDFVKFDNTLNDEFEDELILLRIPEDKMSESVVQYMFKKNRYMRDKKGKRRENDDSSYNENLFPIKRNIENGTLEHSTIKTTLTTQGRSNRRRKIVRFTQSETTEGSIVSSQRQNKRRRNRIQSTTPGSQYTLPSSASSTINFKRRRNRTNKPILIQVPTTVPASITPLSVISSTSTGFYITINDNEIVTGNSLNTSSSTVIDNIKEGKDDNETFNYSVSLTDNIYTPINETSTVSGLNISKELPNFTKNKSENDGTIDVETTETSTIKEYKSASIINVDTRKPVESKNNVSSMVRNLALQNDSMGKNYYTEEKDFTSSYEGSPSVDKSEGEQFENQHNDLKLSTNQEDITTTESSFTFEDGNTTPLMKNEQENQNEILIIPTEYSVENLEKMYNVNSTSAPENDFTSDDMMLLNESKNSVKKEPHNNENVRTTTVREIIPDVFHTSQIPTTYFEEYVINDATTISHSMNIKQINLTTSTTNSDANALEILALNSSENEATSSSTIDLTVQSLSHSQKAKKEETGHEKRKEKSGTIDAKEGERSLLSSTLPIKDDERFDSEGKIYKTNLRRSGSLGNREQNFESRNKLNANATSTLQPTIRFTRPEYPDAVFSDVTLAQSTEPTGDESIFIVNLDNAEVHRVDQSSKAQELDVRVADLPESNSTISSGKSTYKTTFRRKISTTERPRLESVTIHPTVSTLRRRQGLKFNSKKATTDYVPRLRRPPIVDYDYYEDDEVPIIGKPILNGKLYVTGRGAIRCLDQGNFPHPTSCKKFITCARMVNGLVVGTEYTCPAKLSFDPVGGICNWAAGLGCEE